MRNHGHFWPYIEILGRISTQHCLDFLYFLRSETRDLRSIASYCFALDIRSALSIKQYCSLFCTWIFITACWKAVLRAETARWTAAYLTGETSTKPCICISSTGGHAVPGLQASQQLSDNRLRAWSSVASMKLLLNLIEDTRSTTNYMQ